MSLAIQAEGLVKRFKETVALNGVDLEVPTGKVVGADRFAPGATACSRTPPGRTRGRSGMATGYRLPRAHSPS